MILCNASWGLVILSGLTTHKFSSKSDCYKNFRKRLIKSLRNKLKNLRSSTTHWDWGRSPVIPISDCPAQRAQWQLRCSCHSTQWSKCRLIIRPYVTLTLYPFSVSLILMLMYVGFLRSWENYRILIQTGIYMAICFQDCFIFQGGSADPPHSCPYPIPALPPLSSKASPKSLLSA